MAESTSKVVELIKMKSVFVDAFNSFINDVNTRDDGNGAAHVYVNADYDNDNEIVDNTNGSFLLIDFAGSKDTDTLHSTVLVSPPDLNRSPTSLRFVNANRSKSGKNPIVGITTLSDGVPIDPVKDMDLLVDTSLLMNQMSYMPLFTAKGDMFNEAQLNTLARQPEDAYDIEKAEYETGERKYDPNNRSIAYYTHAISEANDFDSALSILAELNGNKVKDGVVTADDTLKLESNVTAFKSMLQFAAYAKVLEYVAEDQVALVNKVCGVDEAETDKAYENLNDPNSNNHFAVLSLSAKKILGLDNLETAIYDLSDTFANAYKAGDKPLDKFDVSTLGNSAALGLCALGVYKAIVSSNKSKEKDLTKGLSLSPSAYATLGCATMMNSRERDIAEQKQALNEALGTDASSNKSCYPKYTCSSAETGRNFEGLSNGAIKAEASGVRVDDDELYRICASGYMITGSDNKKEFLVCNNPYKPLGIREGSLVFDPSKSNTKVLNDAIQINNMDLGCFNIATEDGLLSICDGNKLCVNNFKGFPMMEKLKPDDVDIMKKAVRDAYISHVRYTGHNLANNPAIDMAGLDFQVFKGLYQPSDKKAMKIGEESVDYKRNEGESYTPIAVAKLLRSSDKQAPLAKMHISGVPDAKLGTMAFGWLYAKAVAYSAIDSNKIDPDKIYSVDNKIRYTENLLKCMDIVENDPKLKEHDAYKAYAAYKEYVDNKYPTEIMCEKEAFDDVNNVFNVVMDTNDVSVLRDFFARENARKAGSDVVRAEDKVYADSMMSDKAKALDALSDVYCERSKAYFTANAKANDFLVMMDTYRPATETSIKNLANDIDSMYDSKDTGKAHLYRPQSGFDAAIIKHLVVNHGIDPGDYFEVNNVKDFQKAVLTAATDCGATQALVEDAKRAVMSRATAMNDCNARFIVDICNVINGGSENKNGKDGKGSVVMEGTKELFGQYKSASEEDTNAPDDTRSIPGE